MNDHALDLDAFTALGAQLGRDLATGSVVWLVGPLGAGKTTLVRAIVAGRGADQAATSPTFGLVHHYHGHHGAIYHVDCYRARHPDDTADFDWHTLATADLLLIEWPERGGSWAPPATRTITIDVVDDTHRAVELR